MNKKIPILLSVVTVGSLIFSGCGAKPEETQKEKMTSEKKENSNPVTSTPPLDSIPKLHGEDFGVPNNPPIDPPSSLQEEKTEAVADAKSFTDGTYTAVGSYISPAGPETIGVEVVLENNIITGVSVSPKATNQTSIKMQGLFSQGITSVIVGKPIEEVKSVAAVNGSSLSGQGFIDALNKIKDEAML